MLVLSRRKDETIMVGDEVEITIVDVRGDTVRLGIKAPRSVSVHRKEIYDAIQAENIAAAQESTPAETTAGGLDSLGSLLKSDAKSGKLSGLGKLSGGKLTSNTRSSTRTARKGGLDKLTGGTACPTPPPAPPPAGLDSLLSKFPPKE